MAERPGNDVVCTWCGADAQVAGYPCQRCGRVTVRLPSWALERQRRWLTRRRLVVATVAIFLLGLIIWSNYPFLPDPVVLLFRQPVTQLTSDSPPEQWYMDGRDIQQTRYVPIPQASSHSRASRQAVSPQPTGRTSWARELGEATSSAPAVVDGVIYLGSHFKIIALDAETGGTVWETETSGPVHSSPAVAGDKLYFGLLDHRLVALDRKSGESLWHFKTQDIVTASPAVANGMVYIGSWDGFLYALDAATGKLLWKYKTRGPIRSPPAINGGGLFVSSSDGSLYILNARTGQSRLRFRTPGVALESPITANGLVYFTAGGVLYAVDAGAREIPGQYQFKQVWAQFWIWRIPGIPRPPGQQGGRWKFSPERVSKGFAASLAVSPDTLYVGDTQGNLHARDALLGNELWQFHAGGPIVGSSVIVGDQAYFGAKDGFLYALNRASGKLSWRLSLGAPIEVPPTFAGGRLYVRTTDGRLHAIE